MFNLYEPLSVPHITNVRAQMYIQNSWHCSHSHAVLHLCKNWFNILYLFRGCKY